MRATRLRTHAVFFFLKSVPWRRFAGLSMGVVIALQSTPTSAATPAIRLLSGGSSDEVRVLSVTQEIIEHTEKTEACWQTIVSDRERAKAQYESQPWVVKYWKPILGGLLGMGVGFHFTRNYGEHSQKWFYPTLLTGAAVGAVAGPGMVMGAYGGGTLAQHFWPTKLPLTIMLSMIGGILGDGLFKLLFPDSPPPHLLVPTQPGVYLADQQFYLETRCLPTTRVTYTEKPYRVTYRYQGDLTSALLKHYPGDRLQLDGAGRPLNELKPAKP